MPRGPFVSTRQFAARGNGAKAVGQDQASAGMLFIFPSTFIVLLRPTILEVMHSSIIELMNRVGIGPLCKLKFNRWPGGPHHLCMCSLLGPHSLREPRSRKQEDFDHGKSEPNQACCEFARGGGCSLEPRRPLAAASVSAGCQQTPRSARIPARPRSAPTFFFTREDEDARSFNRFVTADRQTPARTDATLRPYHFQGAGVNSLGMQKLDLMTKAERGDSP